MSNYFSSAILEEMNDGYPSFDLKSSVTQYFDTANFDGRQNSYRSSTRVACDPRLEDAAVDCLTVSPEIPDHRSFDSLTWFLNRFLGQGL